MTDDLEVEDQTLRERVAVARPAADPIRRAVLLARTANALFGATESVAVGRYELLREVATGGGGVVFVARDPQLDREIAVKLVSLHERALAEAQALARVRHPNVVSVFDVGVAGDRIYVAMELVDGESLRSYAVHASAREVIAAYRQLGEGLVAAHAAGIVHGDVKPDNAVVGRDGWVRLVDFGLASSEGGAGRGGTPRYMAPEQRDGSTVTAATDQYAFGVALGEAVTRSSAEPLPRWLAPIVERATSREPSERFETMTALLRVLADDPRARWRRRSRYAAAIAVLAAIAVAGIAVATRTDKPTGNGIIDVPEQVRVTANAPLQRAEAAFKRGDYATAVAEFQRAYDAYPVPELLWNLAIAHDRAGQCREALRLFDLYVLRSPVRDAEHRHIKAVRARCDAGS